MEPGKSPTFVIIQNSSFTDMYLSSENLIIVLLIVVIIGILVYFIFRPKAKPEEKKEVSGPSTLPLQLQAYERLIILTERIGLRNLISSLPTDGFSSKEYQAILVETIKKEYEYNVSQQIYVTPQVWEAVQSLKEQNIFVLNQLSSYIGQEATGKDLAKAIAEYLSGNQDASLQQIVTDALSIEAKKLMH
jgi:hypothetical protein